MDKYSISKIRNYSISKIRNGEVSVKLTSLEQFKKIAPDNNIANFRKDTYHKFVLHNNFMWIPNMLVSPFTKCDFHQIDWEEGKEETDASKFLAIKGLKDTLFDVSNPSADNWIKGGLSQLLEEYTSIHKAENERLSKENEELTTTVKVLYRKLEGTNQELTLKQRMAWELWKAGGITLEQAYQDVDNFLNYKGGENDK